MEGYISKALLALDVVALVYYCETLEAITTLAHALAMILGAVLYYIDLLWDRRQGSRLPDIAPDDRTNLVPTS